MSPQRRLHPSTVDEVLEYLGRPSGHEQPMEGALQRVTDLARTVLPGNPEASVTLVVREHPSSVVATGSASLSPRDPYPSHLCTQPAS